MFFLLLLPGRVQAADILELTDNRNIYNLPRFMDILEDKTQNLTVYEVASDQWADKFMPNPQSHPNFNFSSSAFWARIQIKNSSREIEWVLVCLNSTMQAIDNVELYVPGTDGTFRTIVREKGHPMVQEPNASMFIVSIPPGRQKTVYLRVHDEGLTLFPFYLFSQRSVRLLNRLSVYIYVILGIIIFFFIYNLLLFSSLKDKVFLF